MKKIVKTMSIMSQAVFITVITLMCVIGITMWVRLGDRDAVMVWWQAEGNVVGRALAIAAYATSPIGFVSWVILTKIERDENVKRLLTQAELLCAEPSNRYLKGIKVNKKAGD